MPVVAIPEIGDVQFPDSMSRDDIAAASKRLYTEKVTAAQAAKPQPSDLPLPSKTSLSDEAVASVMEQGAGKTVSKLPYTPPAQPEPPGRRTTMPQGTEEWINFMAEGTLNPLKQAETAIEQTAIQTGLAQPGSRLKYRPSELMQAPLVEIPQIPKVENPILQVGAGAVNAASDFINFFGTTEGLATLGLTKFPKAIQKAVLAGFSGEMLKNFPEQLNKAMELFHEGNYQEGTRQLLSGAGGMLLGLKIGQHATGFGETTPQTKKAVEGGEQNASSVSKAATVYGNVSPLPAEGQGQVPKPESGAGVQPQTKGGLSTPVGGAGKVEAEWFGPKNEPLTIIDYNPKKKTVLVRPFDNPQSPAYELKAKDVKQLKPGVVEPTAFTAEAAFNVDAAERAAIDAGDVEFKDSLSSNEPFAGRIATIDRTTGKVLVNRGEFRAWLADIPPEQRPEAIRSLIDEERIHMATPDEVAKGYWEGLTAAEKTLVRRRYTGKWAGVEGFTDTDLGHEALRGRLQQLSEITPREIAEAKGLEWLTTRSVYALESAIFEIRNALGTKASIAQTAFLDRVQGNLDAAKNVLRGTSATKPAGQEDPRIKELRLEGVNAEDAAALIAGTKTIQNVVDGTFKVTPERIAIPGGQGPIGHAEAFMLGREQAIDRLTKILDPSSERNGYWKLLAELEKTPPETPSTPSAYRKGSQPKKEEGPGLPLATAQQGEPRPDFNLPTGKEPINAQAVEEATTKQLSSKKPSFNAFLADIQEKHGAVQAGQVRDVWEDSVWKKLMDAPGEQIGSMLKGLGLAREFSEEWGGTKIADKQGAAETEMISATRERLLKESQTLNKQADRLEKATALPLGIEVKSSKVADIRKKADHLEQLARSDNVNAIVPEIIRTTEGGTEPARARLDAIGKIATKLISQSEPGREALNRKAVGPEDIRLAPRRDVEPSFREISQADVKRSDLGDILTSGAAGQSRTGKKAPPESVTRRVTALLDTKKGTVNLVSTYKTGRGETYIVDPRRSFLARPNVPLSKLINEGTYRPIASVLLDEPVQNFNQKFKDLSDWRENFADAADRQSQRMQEYMEQQPQQPEQVVAKPAYRTGEPLTDAEARRLYNFFTNDQQTDLSHVQSSLEALFRENRPTDPSTGQPRALTASENAVVDALNKAVQVEGQKKGLAPEAALSNVLEFIYENSNLPTLLGPGQSRQGRFIETFLSNFRPEAKQPVKGTETTATTTPNPPAGTVNDVGTGTATEGEPSPTATRDELGPLPPSTPAAFRKPAAVQTIQNKWDRLKVELRAAGKRSDTFARITKLSDAARNLPAVAGRQARQALNMALGDEGTQAYKDRDAAIIPLIQAKGDITKLDVFESNVRAGLLRDTGNGYQAGVDAGKKMLAAIDYARQNFADRGLLLAARKFNKETREQFLQEKNAGINLRFENDYVPQRYDPELWNDQSILFPDEGALGRRFEKARVFKNYFEAYAFTDPVTQNSYIPKSFSAMNILEHRVREGQRRIAMRQWTEKLKALIDPVTGEPVARDMVTMIRTVPGGPGQPARTITEQVLPDANHVEQTFSGSGRLAVRKGYTKILRILTDPSAVESFEVAGIPVGHAALHVNALTKHGVILILDSFHPSRLIQMGMAVTGISKDMGKFWNKGWSALEFRDADLNEAVRKGYISAQEAAWSREPVNVRLPGGRSQTLTRREILERMSQEGLNVGSISDALRKHVVENWPVIGRMNRWTFDRLTRGLLAHTAVESFETLNKKYPEMDVRKLMDQVIKDTNIFYGSIGRQGWFRSATMRDAMSLLFLAPQWVERMIQSEARAYTRAARLATFTYKRGEPKLGVIGRGVGRGLMAYMALTQIGNVITTGHPTWMNEDDKSGSHKLDMWIPDFTGKSKGYWLSPQSVFGEVAHDLTRFMERKNVKTGEDAVGTFLANKLNLWGRFLRVMTRGGEQRGAFGEKLSKNKAIATGQIGLKAAGELVPSPISLKAPLQSLGSTIAPGVIPEPQPGKLQQQLMGSAGIKTTMVTNAVPKTGLQYIRSQRRERIRQQRGE